MLDGGKERQEKCEENKKEFMNYGKIDYFYFMFLSIRIKRVGSTTCLFKIVVGLEFWIIEMFKSNNAIKKKIKFLFIQNI